MTNGCFKQGCPGCEFSKGKGTVGGNVILPGGWSLNHYQGPEGYLGWLALQPVCHRMSFSKLTEVELRHLGPNIRDIERVLSKYWSEAFKDNVERLYIIYFFEGGGDHLHLHLIPRFASLEQRLRDWEAPRATKSATFPPQYRNDAADFNEHVERLMQHLRSNLHGVLASR